MPKWFALFALVVSLVAIGRADDATQLRQALTIQSDLALALQLRSTKFNDPLLAARASAFAADGQVTAREREQLAAWLKLSQAPTAEPPSAAQLDPHRIANEVRSRPEFGTRDIADDSNWLGRALQRLRAIQWPKFRPPPMRGMAPPGLGEAFRIVVWLVLGAAVATIAVLIAKHVRWRKRLQRTARAMLEEDEPQLSRDEWLETADRLAAEGRHREAVRALYLASLLVFDERRVARFERMQTNWEHLARITASPSLPSTIDFRPPTQHFDVVWYGHRVRGVEDVTQMREFYTSLVDSFAGAAV